MVESSGEKRRSCSRKVKVPHPFDLRSGQALSLQNREQKDGRSRWVSSFLSDKNVRPTRDLRK